LSPEQQQIDHGPREFPGGCVYCGFKPAHPFEIEKARYGKAPNGTRVVKRQPVVVALCDRHFRQLSRGEKD
jgi:hypothetical protein